MLVLLATVVAVTSSVGAPLIPAVADRYDVPLHAAQWSLTMPLLVGVVATPVLGRLGNGPRRRAVALGALVLVVLGGVLTALPLPFGAFLAGRGLQGFGLGLMPLLVATARDALPAPRAARAIAVLSITVVSGVGLGYPIAGAIATTAGTAAAFWTATAVCAGALAAAAAVLPPAAPAAPRRFDLPGALLLGAGIAGALVTLGEGGTWGWSSVRVLVLGTASLLLLAAWVAVALRVTAPLIDLRLARGRLPAAGHVTVLLIGLSNYLLLGSLPTLAQAPAGSGAGLGASGLVAGLLLLPFSLAGMLAGPLSRRLGERVRPRSVLAAGALLVATAEAVFAAHRADLWTLAAVAAVTGLGVSTVFAAAAGVVVACAPPRETGSAMALNQVLRYAGFSVGSALTGTVLAAATPAGGGLPAGGAYTVIGAVGCGTAVLAALAAWLLAGRDAGGDAVGPDPAGAPRPGARGRGARRTGPPGAQARA
ncbi:MFS transporter [Geodermatophilus marinus]|uniref:MFS transporter n=1 Tax=Geodermatophilus sp. LHW52908 TaxID=2303986 RepID=UPI000E3C07B5|nr:MFS transporter [Geodermatophilus sp. LHW52908]RFU21546.1 MFS transporter [Geodermatophilus sp. LHW52908]